METLAGRRWKEEDAGQHEALTRKIAVRRRFGSGDGKSINRADG